MVPVSTSTTTAREVSPPGEPDDWERYRRAFLNLRLGIGLLGGALPVAPVRGDVAVLEGSPTARGSLSAYYHSGMRDLFVGGLMVVGVFLVTYRVTRHRPTNRTTTAAGIAGIGVAVFPTKGLPGYTPTPLQDYVGEGVSSTVHAVSAGAFILLLALMSFWFGRDAVRFGTPADQAPAGQARIPGWAVYHFTCLAIILAACLFILVTKVSGVFDQYSLLIGETAAVMAFGASWLSKGLELRRLPGWLRR